MTTDWVTQYGRKGVPHCCAGQKAQTSLMGPEPRCGRGGALQAGPRQDSFLLFLLQCCQQSSAGGPTTPVSASVASSLSPLYVCVSSPSTSPGTVCRGLAPCDLLSLNPQKRSCASPGCPPRPLTSPESLLALP